MDLLGKRKEKEVEHVNGDTTQPREAVDVGARAAIEQLKKKQRDFDARLARLEREKGVIGAGN